jgi:hypothetical protein
MISCTGSKRLSNPSNVIRGLIVKQQWGSSSLVQQAGGSEFKFNRVRQYVHVTVCLICMHEGKEVELVAYDTDPLL